MITDLDPPLFACSESRLRSSVEVGLSDVVLSFSVVPCLQTADSGVKIAGYLTAPLRIYCGCNGLEGDVERG